MPSSAASRPSTASGLVVVDYLQLMSGRGRFENRNQEVSAIRAA